MRLLVRHCGCLALACLLARSACCAEAEPAPRAGADAATVKAAANKLGLLARMLEGDTMARRVDASGNAVAQESFKLARAAHQRAVAQQAQGDAAAADQSANEALRLLREALKAADSKSIDEAKRKADYQARRERVQGFREAYARIQAEKTRSRGGMLDEQQLDELVAQAEAQARQGRYDEGSQLLARASALLEQALTRLRDKETLVHELKFASVEEELQYERNRNQSYALLLDIVVAEKNTPGLQDLVQGALSANQAARARAEAAEQGADVRAALRILEGATAALAQALRAAGVPVP